MALKDNKSIVKYDDFKKIQILFPNHFSQDPVLGSSSGLIHAKSHQLPQHPHHSSRTGDYQEYYCNPDSY